MIVRSYAGGITTVMGQGITNERAFAASLQWPTARGKWHDYAFGNERLMRPLCNKAVSLSSTTVPVRLPVCS